MKFNAKEKRLNRLKRFLMNAEAKYPPKELITNWSIWISLFLMILFGVLFSIYSKDIKINSFSQVGIAIPEPASSFSTVAFVFLLILIVSLILKMVFRRKRNK